MKIEISESLARTLIGKFNVSKKGTESKVVIDLTQDIIVWNDLRGSTYVLHPDNRSYLSEIAKRYSDILFNQSPYISHIMYPDKIIAIKVEYTYYLEVDSLEEFFKSTEETYKVYYWKESDTFHILEDED